MSSIVNLNKASLSSRLILDAVLEIRRCRARAALVTAWVLHLTRQTALSLRYEGLRILAGSESLPETAKPVSAIEKPTAGLAPPGSLEGLPVWFFLYFLKDEVLFDWKWIAREDAVAVDAGKKGDACDRLLVDLAHHHGVPVITTEVKAGGAIAKRAKPLSVVVLTPAAWTLSCIAKTQELEKNIDDLALQLLRRAEDEMMMFITSPARRHSQIFQENCADYMTMLRWILDSSEETISTDPMDGWRFQTLCKSNEN